MRVADLTQLYSVGGSITVRPLPLGPINNLSPARSLHSVGPHTGRCSVAPCVLLLYVTVGVSPPRPATAEGTLALPAGEVVGGPAGLATQPS